MPRQNEPVINIEHENVLVPTNFDYIDSTHNFQLFKRLLMAAIKSVSGNLIVSLIHLPTSRASTFWMLLFKMAIAMKKNHRLLVLADLNEAQLRVVELLGVDKILPCFGSYHEANEFLLNKAMDHG